MDAILRDIKIWKNDDSYHRINMMFSAPSNDEELFGYTTSIENQYCTEEEREEDLSDEDLEEKLLFAKSQIGLYFDVNLYKISIQELTNNNYWAFQVPVSEFETRNMTEYRIATYMTREDTIANLRFKALFNNSIKGILANGATEAIKIEYLFPPSIRQQKTFEIPYTKFCNLTPEYILQFASIDEIRKGRYLAFELKDSIIAQSDFDKSIQQIEDYRSRLIKAKAVNESLRKKIFFWESKEVVEKLNLRLNFISMAIDSIILYRLYPADCERARKEYVEECEKRLRKKYLNEDPNKEFLKDRRLVFFKTLKEKYRGMSIIKVSSIQRGLISSVSKINGFSDKRPYARVVFKRFQEDSREYEVIYNLQYIYNEVFINDNIAFDGERAYELFTEEMIVGCYEEINLFDIPIEEISNYKYLREVRTGEEFSILPIASYEERSQAIEVAKSRIKKKFELKLWEPV